MVTGSFGFDRVNNDVDFLPLLNVADEDCFGVNTMGLLLLFFLFLFVVAGYFFKLACFCLILVIDVRTFGAVDEFHFFLLQSKDDSPLKSIYSSIPKLANARLVICQKRTE